MSSQQSSHADRDFFTVAAEHHLLSSEVAHELAREASARNVHPTQIVLQKGLLDVVQIDIVETLLNATKIVPDYEILDVIGKGGMGVVYRARQKSLDRIVALKTVLVSQMGDPSMVGRFEREAVTVARLRHPNIVAAYDFGRHEGRLFFAMELVEGTDVEKLIRERGKLDEATTLGLVRQAAAGLAHATQAGIVHRDIKPANLLLVEPPEGFPLPKGLLLVKIADFGLAFLTGEQDAQTRLTAADATVGSPHYMAPEQIKGQTIDHRSDIYSLGATMFHMLAGRPPFDGKTLSQIIAQKLSGDTPSLLDVSADVSQQSRQLVDDMLHHDPDRRLADYSRLIDRIDALTGTLQPVLHVGRPSGMATLSSVVEAIPTQPLSLPNNTPTEAVRSRRRLFKLAGVIILGTVVAALITAQLLTNRSPVSSPRRDMVPSGWSESLFNGQTLGALPASGAWVVGKDDEGAIVIAGTEGTIRRTLFRNDLREPRPLENYRLQLFVRLHKALAVELHFGITADKSRDGPRSVLRMTPEQIVLGRRSSDRGELNSITQTLSLAKGNDQYRVFMVERQRGHWWVFFDEELVGTVNRQAEPQLPEFRLTVEGGPAWFSDLQVEELVVSDNREN